MQYNICKHFYGPLPDGIAAGLLVRLSEESRKKQPCCLILCYEQTYYSIKVMIYDRHHDATTKLTSHLIAARTASANESSTTATAIEVALRVLVPVSRGLERRALIV